MQTDINILCFVTNDTLKKAQSGGKIFSPVDYVCNSQ